jgi:hypothetical protein
LHTIAAPEVGWQRGHLDRAAADTGRRARLASLGLPTAGPGRLVACVGFWLALIGPGSLAAEPVAREVDAAAAATPAQLEAALAGMTPAEQGKAIWTTKDRLESGYVDLQVRLEMVLRDRRGTESRRELSISQLEQNDAGDRLLVVFDTPKQIRGTALLSYSYPTAPDDQWLYLPAAKRVKRIASQNKSGPFLSSEFAFEDMVLQELEKFDYALLGSGACGAAACYRVERKPHDPHSGYTRQEVLLERDTLRIERVDYFDRAGRPLKVLKVDDYAEYGGRFWKAGRMLMENLQTGKTTELFWRDYRFATGLSAERDFSTNSLARAR